MARLGFAMAALGLSLAATPALAFTVVPITPAQAGVRADDPRAALAGAGSAYQSRYVDDALRYGPAGATFAAGANPYFNAPAVTSRFGPMSVTTSVNNSNDRWQNSYFGARNFAPGFGSSIGSSFGSRDYQPIPGLPHR